MRPRFPTSFILVAAGLIPIACQAPDPPQPTYNLPSHDDMFQADLVLTPSAEQQVLALMRNAVPSDSPGVLAPARYGVRWSDVDSAVRWGAGVIEMAVLSAQRDDATSAHAATDGVGQEPGAATPERWVYRIITVADDPVTLTVTREPPPAIYSMRAVAGVFDDRRDIEERLKTEVHAAMLRFGAKPMPTTLDE